MGQDLEAPCGEEDAERRGGGQARRRGGSSSDFAGGVPPGRAGSWTVLVCVSRDRQRIRNEPQWGQLRSRSPRGDPSFPIPSTSSPQPPPRPPIPPPPHTHNARSHFGGAWGGKGGLASAGWLQTSGARVGEMRARSPRNPFFFCPGPSRVGSLSFQAQAGSAIDCPGRARTGPPAQRAGFSR